jgi:hypothetical protein
LIYRENPHQEDAEAGMSQARPTANFGGDVEAQEDDQDVYEESKHNSSEEEEGEDLLDNADK